MSSSRWISLFAASLFALTACNDSTAPTPRPAAIAPSPATLVTLYGTISVTGRDPLHSLVLTMDDGTEVALSVNSETTPLSALAGAGVDVRGRWDGAQSFDVEEFIVRQVGGTPVLDGILIEDRTSDIGDDPVVSYMLLLRDGSAAQLTDPAPELLEHVGARMWVRLDDAGMAREFGIIETY